MRLFAIAVSLVLFASCVPPRGPIPPKVLSGAGLEDFAPFPDEEVLREETLRKEEEERRQKGDPLSTRKLQDGSWEIGSPSASLILRVYTDYECEYCEEFERRTGTLLMQEFVSKGLSRYQVAMFPLESIHANAGRAAEAALCAGEQGKFFEMHTSLLGSWRELGDRRYRKLVSDFQLDLPQFLDCYESRTFKDIVAAQKAGGKERGVEAVPTLFIGGMKVEGVHPFGDIRAWVNEEISKR